jgi:hypothetical protein
MPQQQVTARKRSRTLLALEWLFFGVRALVSLQMLQARKRPLALVADVWPRLVRLWRGEGRYGLRRLCGRCGACVVSMLRCRPGCYSLLVLPVLGELPFGLVPSACADMTVYGSGDASPIRHEATARKRGGLTESLVGGEM